jgi:hemerythrin superfamily protein
MAKTPPKFLINDPFKHLEDEHKAVTKLLHKLEKDKDMSVSDKETAFTQLLSALMMHMLMEERALYPVLKQVEKARDMAFEAVEEHHVVKVFLEELAGLSPDAEEWKAKLTVLRENVEHHINEEEGDLFKKGRKALNEDQKQAVARGMERVMRDAS